MRAVNSVKIGTLLCTTGATTTETAGPADPDLALTLFFSPQLAKNTMAAIHAAMPTLLVGIRVGRLERYLSNELMPFLSRNVGSFLSERCAAREYRSTVFQVFANGIRS